MKNHKRAIDWQALAKQAIEEGCPSAGDFILGLALRHIHLPPQAVTEVYRVFAEHSGKVCRRVKP